MFKPYRGKLDQKIREIANRYLIKLPIPKINPNFYSGFSVILSVILLFFAERFVMLILFLTIIWCLDILDGVTARKYNIINEDGWSVDHLCDTLSEGIIFSYFFIPWFFLFIVQAALRIYTHKTRRTAGLDLRQVFLIYLIITRILL